MKKTLIRCLSLILILAAPWGTGAYAAGEEAIVVTSFYPIYAMAANLVGNLEEVSLQNLAAPDTGCLHDYQLLSGDMKTLSRATVLCINGAGMESYLDQVLAQFPELPVVDASLHVPLLDGEGNPLIEDEDHEGHDHGHNHNHQVNAHIWLDGDNAVLMVENLAAGLAEALPGHREAILENAATYIARLRALDAELRQGLAPLAGSEMITFHEAFPYFANAYGFHVLAVMEKEPGDALSPRDIIDLVELIREHGQVPLFVEPQYPDLSAKAVAAETGASLYTLDPLVTGPVEVKEAAYAYEEGMRRNMETLLEAFHE